jgi:hypothetical protein
VTFEDQLRDTLRDRAGRAKLPVDVADTAIRHGRAIQHRRRTASMAVAGVVVAIAALGGVSLLRSPAAPPPAPGAAGSVTTSAASHGVAVDVVRDGRFLDTPDGHSYTLDTIPVAFVFRVPAGWVYGRSTGDALLMRPDSRPIPLDGVSVDARPPAPSADGQHLAWTTGGQVHAARITSGGVTGTVDSPAPAGTYTVTWIGERVVLAQPVGNAVQYDVWDPANPTHPDFVPHWTNGLSTVFGPVPDGTTAFAVAAGCPVKVNGVDNMNFTPSVCDLGLGDTTHARLSPDGKTLAVPGPSTQVVDLAAATAVGTCPGTVLGWESGTVLLTANGATVTRCTVNGTDIAAAEVPGADVAGSNLRLVPAYDG